MNMKILLMVLLLVPQLAAARVYMCVDPASGKTSFTDKACEKAAKREEVRVAPTNLDSGSRTGVSKPAKVWSSDRDTRKTGGDYNEQRRQLYENKAIARNDRLAR